ncbi:hypothetical protein [Agromyces sp. ISL-38]|uniref:hypothetical protein n=1 Tax=Agromyces sp. ISL-38 TaxID=2819107 RepID=UPI002034AC49|nr:hypothetical protein [Agromyces sp. ISL-38]
MLVESGRAASSVTAAFAGGDLVALVGGSPRYTGLRLLDRTGTNYFLISDGWTDEYGVVVALPTDDDATRFTFVRDRHGQRNDGGYLPCES